MTLMRPPMESETLRSVPDVRALLSGFSVEATPKQVASHPHLAGLLPAGTAVYIPFLPDATCAEAEQACKRLVEAGYRPVPHLPARQFVDRVELAGWLARFRGAGAEALLLIAGDRAEARGAFADTLAVLDTGLLERHGFHQVGVAGHPEGHPHAPQAELDRALAHKAAYARDTGTEMWLVTQFVFSADPVCRWLDRLAASGFGLPVRVGLPGPASTRTLITYAMQCGVKVSARMLGRRPNVARMMLGRWTPVGPLTGLARHRAAAPDSPLAGIHMFPFGGLQRSAEWIAAVRDGSLALLPTDEPQAREA